MFCFNYNRFICTRVRNEEEAGENMITIRDIAKILGVSHSTISRSLNDSFEISQKTKERIKGYIYALEEKGVKVKKG